MFSLEGLRAVAALGVVVTHVAFQTGADPATFLGSLSARFDFFVAVFFALSAFLLWRRHRTDRTLARAGRYYVNRAGRILPAYLVCVAAVILLLPDAAGMSGTQIAANLTLTQIYVADGLAPGLTHLWSLSVEVAFYLVLPVLALTVGRLSRRARVGVFLAAAVVSLGWAWLPFVESTPAPGVANRQIWPPAYVCWFAVGLLAAEAEGRVPAWCERVFRVRPLWWVLALVVAWVAGQEWFGPLGLVHPSPGEFTARVLAGTAFAALLVVPYALAPGPGLLTSGVMQALGRWSYSIFLWHLAVLAVVFPLAGQGLFQGGFWLVLALTAVGTVPVAAASYVLVEDPARWAVRRLRGPREAARRAGNPGGAGSRQASAAAQTSETNPASPA
nr:acyltransferase [Corynebacterium halotolerans]